MKKIWRIEELRRACNIFHCRHAAVFVYYINRKFYGKDFPKDVPMERSVQPQICGRSILGMKRLLDGSIVVLTAVLLFLVFFVVPPAEGLGNLVRIVFFHVPMAWVSVLAFLMSAWWAAAYLRKGDLGQDALSARSAKVGFVFVLLATVSGAVFSKLTWGAYWNWDPRQTTIFVLILLYGAYLTLRAAVPNERKRARTAAIYSLFSCLTVPFLVFILPRLYFSLHPSPIFNESGRIDMDPVMLGTLLLALTDGTLVYLRMVLCGGEKEVSHA